MSDAALLQKHAQQRGVADVAVYQPVHPSLLQDARSRVLQTNLVVVVEVVQADHGIALSVKLQRRMKADEAGSASDEYHTTAFPCAFGDSARACAHLAERL